MITSNQIAIVDELSLFEICQKIESHEESFPPCLHPEIEFVPFDTTMFDILLLSSFIRFALVGIPQETLYFEYLENGKIKPLNRSTMILSFFHSFMNDDFSLRIDNSAPLINMYENMTYSQMETAQQRMLLNTTFKCVILKYPNTDELKQFIELFKTQRTML